MYLQTMKVFVYDSDSNKAEVGKTLHDVLRDGQQDGRLTCGLYESGLVLETNPDSVMLCVLPMNKSGDVTLDIHYTLIEAFCEENEIRVIKIDSAEKLSKLLGNNNNRKQRVEPDGYFEDNYLDINTSWLVDGSTDYNCVLIEYPEDKCSDQEADLLDYHKQTCTLIPQPIIDLNV